MSNIINNFRNIFTLTDEKRRFLLFAFILILALFTAFYLLRIAYARYETNAKLKADVDKALYIFEDEKLEFNLKTEGIVPSSNPYVYKFSVSNFQDTKTSEIDIEYTVTVKTTTNLPILVQIFKLDANANPGPSLVSGAVVKQDEDNSFYRVYKVPTTYEMLFTDRVTDYFQLEITFPESYKNSMTYENAIENVDVILESKQMAD